MTADAMTPARFQRLKELFAHAVEREGDERRAFLDQACGEDEELRAELEALLEADRRDLDLAVPIAEGVAELLSGAPDTERQIGPYKTLHEIGRGGMSTVYLAARADDQYQKRVAIKLIRRGAESEEIRRRFRQERQILASLEHPNIARLLDGGTTGDGSPYFVMEYIEGEPIDAYCDRRRLSTHERLQLFRTVCSAVHAAHQNLVVHRDLKPGNVLVTTGGVPKLLDFGIAKLLDPELSAQEMRVTAPNLRPMTLAYASPEQLRGEAITTASDVYSLGVMLYELLSGHPPYRFDGRQRRTVERAICETEPAAPSVVVTRAEDGRTPETVARDRRELPKTLRRRLAGDLDAIVLKALRKEPQRRYGSVEQLAEDVRRHLEHLPVKARKETFAYRTMKLVRRNKLAAALVVLVLLFAAAMTLQSVRLADALKTAQNQRVRAEQVSEFLVELFRTSDPSETRGSRVTARELLDQGAWRIDAGLRDQPEVRSALMDTMGLAYQSLGLFDKAQGFLERALLLRRQRAGGAADQDVASSLAHVAFLRHESGDFKAAEALGREALAMRRELFGDEHPLVATSLHNLAEVLYVQGKYDRAEELYTEALAMRRRLLGPEHPEVAETLNELALLLHTEERYGRGEALARGALGIWRKAYGDEHPEVATALRNLARLLVDQGRLEDAEPLLQEALAIERKILGDEHPDTTRTQGDLGFLYLRSGRLDAAAKHLRLALDAALKLWGEDHPHVLEVRNDLALVLSASGDHREAERLFRQTLAGYRATLGPEHPWVATVLGNLGGELEALGEAEAAVAAYEEALRLRRQLRPDGDWQVAYNLLALGRLRGREDPRRAEPLLRESLEIVRRVLPGHWRVAEAMNELGACLTAQRRFDEAEPLLVESYEALAKKPEQEARAAARLAELYEAWKKPAEAARYHRLRRDPP